MAGVGASVRRIPVTWIVGIANVAGLLFTEASGGSLKPAVMIRAGAMARPLLEQGELWRMLTSGFLHFGAIHLLANMWGLYIFGPVLERMVGSVRFAGLYVASLLAGSAAAAFTTPANAVSAGASGAIFGLLGAIGVVGFRWRHTPLGRAWVRQAAVIVGLNVLIGLTDPTIGLSAHLGGLVGGAAVMAVETRGGPRRELEVARPWAGFSAAVILSTGSVLAVALWLR